MICGKCNAKINISDIQGNPRHCPVCNADFTVNPEHLLYESIQEINACHPQVEPISDDITEEEVGQMSENWGPDLTISVMDVIAQNGTSETQFHLAKLLVARGREGDSDRAVDWLSKAYNNGAFRAAYYLYRYYYEKDKTLNEDALNWLIKACEHEDCEALFDYGLFFYYGDHVEADKGKAILLWENAAAAGSKLAQSRLAYLKKTKKEPEKVKGIGKDQNNQPDDRKSEGGFFAGTAEIKQPLQIEKHLVSETSEKDEELPEGTRPDYKEITEKVRIKINDTVSLSQCRNALGLEEKWQLIFLNPADRAYASSMLSAKKVEHGYYSASRIMLSIPGDEMESDRKIMVSGAFIDNGCCNETFSEWEILSALDSIDRLDTGIKDFVSLKDENKIRWCCTDENGKITHVCIESSDIGGCFIGENSTVPVTLIKDGIRYAMFQKNGSPAGVVKSEFYRFLYRLDDSDQISGMPDRVTGISLVIHNGSFHVQGIGNLVLNEY